MAVAKKKNVIDLPLKVIFSDQGITFFVNNNKKLNKFRMADSHEEHGLFLDSFSPPSLQRMLLNDFISKVEISRPEFISKRQEIMDLSKLTVYGVLYKQFDELVFFKVIKSKLIKDWNRSNPGNIIDEKTKINDSYLQNVLNQNQKLVGDIRRAILIPFIERIKRNSDLTAEEKNIQLFLSERYLNNLRPFVWYILSRFMGSTEYRNLLEDLRQALYTYIEKSRIAEYLSLMIMELAIKAENDNLQSFARRNYKDRFDPQEVLFDKSIRDKLLTEMKRLDENVSLSLEFGSKRGAIGIRNRLVVTLYNKETEYNAVKESIDTKKDIDLKRKSLNDFYAESVDTGTTSEMGLYYLSYLNEECSKVGIRFETFVSQLVSSGDSTVITLKLSF